MTKRTLEVDVAILGAGTAGLTARRSAQKAGASVLMIDPGPFGTTCARVGCMPSKLLIAAADAAHHARKADEFGVRVAGVSVDGEAVLARVQRERDRFVGFVRDTIDEAREAGEVLVGRATIVGAGRLRVEGDDGPVEVAYRGLVIATGSTSFVPPPFRGLEDLTLTNEEVFEQRSLPASLLVVGLGVIGLELGQAFHRLGVRTTLLGVGGKVGPISDPEVLAEAKTVFGRELDVHPEYELRAIERLGEGEGVRARFVDSAGVERDEAFARVLMAAGRRPTLDRLGLDAIGIRPGEDRRYAIDPETLQLEDTPIFVAGDVNGLHPLLHEAADDGRIAGANAARFPDIRAATRRTPLGIVFTDPQIGIVGVPFRDLDTRETMVGAVDFGHQGRARVQAVDAGKVRIYGDKHTGRIIGAELFGPRVEHLSHLLAWAVQRGMTAEEALGMPFYHPVVEEGLRSALRDLNANLRRGAPIECAVSELGPGACA